LANKKHDGNLNKLSFDDLAALGTKHLISFYHVRVSDNVMTKPAALQMGKPEQAAKGSPCLLLKFKQVLGRDMLATMPPLEAPQQVPKALEVPETVIDINNKNNIYDFAPSAEWCDKAASDIHPISVNGKLEHWKSNLAELNEKATILATKVQARMKHFLIS
jgi:hypothetical protein